MNKITVTILILILMGFNKTQITFCDEADYLPKVGKEIEMLNSAAASDREFAAAALEALAREHGSEKIAPLAAQPLIAALKDEDPNVRRKAAQTLGYLKDPAATEALIGLLVDKEQRVAQFAAIALGKIRDPRAVEPLMALLKENGYGIKSYCIQALGNLGDPKAAESLVKALKEDKYINPADIFKALKEINYSGSKELLFKAMDNTKPAYDETRLYMALCELGESEAAVKHLIALLDADAAVVRTGAVKELANIVEWSSRGTFGAGPLAATDAILKFYRDGKADALDAGERLKILEKIKDERAVEIIIDGFKGEYREGAAMLGGMPQGTAFTLARMAPVAQEPLIRALGNEDESTRAKAAWILGYIKVRENPKAVKPLRAALGDRSEMVRANAVTSLGKLGGRDARESIINVVADKDESPKVRCAAIRALVETKDPRAIDILTDILGDKKDELPVRIETVHTLAAADNPRARNTLDTVRNDNGESAELKAAIISAEQMISVMRRGR